MDADSAVDVFLRAADANLSARDRRGATLHMPDRQKVLMTGDLHDHGLNLQRILKLATLDEGPDRHVILHELIHGPHFVNGRDMSIRTLMRVAALKLQYPDQVHLMLANHDLSQLGGEGISKDGVNVVKAFDEGVDYIFGEDADRVREAMKTFVRSLLLAVRMPNGVMCCHSLPSPRQMETFDFEVIDRVPTDEDVAPRGSAHALVWGRYHTPEQGEAMMQKWGVKLFLLGHQPADMGYLIETRDILVLASDHSQGMALPLNSSRTYNMDKCIEELVPLASVVV